MELSQLVESFLKYALAPLAAVIWYMFKRQDGRIDQLEKRMLDNEKTLIELRAEFKYIREDIADIKAMLVKLAEKIKW